MPAKLTLKSLRDNKVSVHPSLRTLTQSGTKVVTLATFARTPVFMQQSRFRVYENNDYKCVSCSAAGTHVILSASGAKRVRANLIGLSNGQWTLFTKDHIVPRARNGSNLQTNLQTMCQPCNNAKGDRKNVTGKKWT